MHRFKVIGRDMVHRWEGNPLIGIDDLDFRCSNILNAGVALCQGRTILLVTIEDLAGYRSIHLAREGPDGRFHVEERPFMTRSSDPVARKHETGGVCDARLTLLDGVYYIMHVAQGEHGFRLALAKTTDFVEIEHIGLVSEPDTKGGALFPRKIAGRFARIERPGEGRSLWASYSDDLVYWGGAELVITPRGGYWDPSWIGIGPPPFEIAEGWLVIYYGAKDTSSGPIYRLGAVVLDRENPTEVLGRSDTPILTPRERYERIGDLPNIVFSTGAILDGKTGELRIYYGAADSCICLGTAGVQQIVDHCLGGGGGR